MLGLGFTYDLSYSIMVIVVEIHIKTNKSRNLRDITGVKTMRVANKNARQYVDELKIFEGSNTFAENKVSFDDENLYVVYSYGYHFPMYIYDRQAGIWIGSNDSYSVSTSKQQSQCRPSGKIHCWLDTAEEMKEYIKCGSMMKYMEIKAKRVA
tara:strand:- start:889 stop:1347 length:459 start_codon:yes stop_codon:yes gene_type:complete